MTIPELSLGTDLFGSDESTRQSALVSALRQLTQHHYESSSDYRGIVDAMFADWHMGDDLADLPFLPVGLFKRRTIKSVTDAEVFKTVTSSGTGGVPSRVHLDRVTATRQTRALTAIMAQVLGPGRRPMLLVDTDALLTERSDRTARAAGVVGLAGLGRKHVFLLDSEMEVQAERLIDFANDHAGQPKLIFGFTYMVWRYLYQHLKGSGVDLSGATLVHSGGWKQMESERVDNPTFKAKLHDAFGIDHVVNFYGMAEQVGSVFIEGNDGLLHPSALADVIVRNPHTWEPQPHGTEGVIQVLSMVPSSYPGHSILTEDRGIIETVDDQCHGLGGKAFRVLGRLPKAELRGCSDTFAAGQHA